MLLNNIKHLKAKQYQCITIDEDNHLIKSLGNETELVEFAQGHANAFGISIFEENFEDFKEKTKNITKEKPTYEVDLHMHGKHSIDEVLKVDEHE